MPPRWGFLGGRYPFSTNRPLLRSCRKTKFLTVRNLLTPTPGRSYDCVSANSLQCRQALHGSAPASLSDRQQDLPCNSTLERRASVPLSLRGTSGEGWGEGKSNKNATPLPGPLLRLRRKRGRRTQSIPLIRCQSDEAPAQPLLRPSSAGRERQSAPERSHLLRPPGLLIRFCREATPVSPRMPSAVGQASPPAGSSGFQPRVGVRSPRPSRNLGQDAPKTGRLEACPSAPESAL